MNVRFTIKCPKLAQFKAKGISPDDAKTMSNADIKSQSSINDKYNKRGIELGDILIGKLSDVDMTWCNDGCVVISCSNTIAQVEKVIADEGLEIQPDRSEIKHKVRPLGVNDEDKGSEEDIDKVFEPKTKGELKKLKSTPRDNLYLANRI
jgi:hypothetical protein